MARGGVFTKKWIVASLLFLSLFIFSCNHNNSEKGGEKNKPEKTVLSPPSGITATATENVGELLVKWKAVVGNNGYKVFYKTAGVEKSADVSKDATSTVLNGLQGGVEYSLRLKTVGDLSKYADSAFSLEVKATPKDGKLHLKSPASFVVKATGEIGEVECSWEAVQHVSSYIISYKKSASQEVAKTQTITSDKVECKISSLENNVEYSFSIMSKGDGVTYLDSDASAEVKATPNNRLPAPKNIRVFPIDADDTIFIKWNNIEHNNGYVIKYKEGNNENTVEAGKDEVEGTLQALNPGTEYIISIQTKAQSGYSDSVFSENVKCTTLKSADVLSLKKIEIAGSEDLPKSIFSETSVEGEGIVVHRNPKDIIFAPTDTEVEIKPTFEGASLKKYFILSGTEKKELEGNKIKFEKDKFYQFELVAQTNSGMLIKWVFSGKAIDSKIDVLTLHLKRDYASSTAPTSDVLEQAIEGVKNLISPKLKNEKNLKLNIKKDASLAMQNFIFIVSIKNDDDVAKVEFDNAEAQTETIQGRKRYYKLLTPDSQGKAILNAKFTAKSGLVEERVYEFALSDKRIDTDIDKVVFGDKEFDVVAMPSTRLTVFVPEEYKDKSYPISLKFTNGATYNLYFYDEAIKDWKKVNAGDSLAISGDKDGFMVDVIPEIGSGIYDWSDTQIEILTGLKDAPAIDALKDITMGEDNPISIKGATSAANAVEVAAKDTRSIVVAFDDDNSFDDEIGFYTAKEYMEFLNLSQKDRLNAELEEPSQTDLKESEATEFVIILTRETAEGYKDVVYHVWLKKKA